MKTNQTFGIFGSSRRQLRKITCAPMIALFRSVGDAFEKSRWMIELARDFDSQFGATHHGVVINRNPAIGRDEFALFSQYQRIDFQRPRFHAARGSKQLPDRIGELLGVRWGKSARSNSFTHR